MKLKALPVAVLAAIFSVPLLAGIWVDYLWFESLGYLSVFTTVISTRILLFFGILVITTSFIWINLKIAGKTVDLEELRLEARLKGFEIFGALSLVVGLLAAFVFSTFYMTVLKFLNGVPFGIEEAVFGNDISFYFFNLPFWSLLSSYFLVLFLLTAGILGAFYYMAVYKKRSADGDWNSILGGARKHLSCLAGLFFVAVSARVFILRYSVLYSDIGAVFGAGYVDVNILLPLITLVSLISLAVGLLFLADLKLNEFRYPIYGLVILVAVLVLGGVASAVVQSYYVEPAEFTLEEEYIERNINHTRDAFGLDDMQEIYFTPTYNLTAGDIEERGSTFDNLRLWDRRVLKDTYSSVQELRTYYEFEDVDVDRYHFEDGRKQVMLSVREMDADRLPERAQTWVNRHLVYTHGIGVAMSPVREITARGQPVFYMKDIPTTVTDEAPEKGILELDNPRTYFGERTDNFVVVDTKQSEFDYPRGDENIYTVYTGEDGVELGLLDRLAFSITLGDLRLLLSGDITESSRILIRRNIHERVRELAPFLQYDEDPYPVVYDGGIKWIYDSYTTSDRYPYSEPHGDINYIRNSVKTTIDAYDGTTNFYVVEDDPLAETYRNIFPDLFKDEESMDDDLVKHIRYPKDIFRTQAEMLTTYHMKDPRVFYNREDQWEIPMESYRGRTQKMEPYYVTLDLPEEEETQFTLMIPFTPEGRPNMIGWLGAKSDGDGYGEKLLYRFSRETLMYGPSQVESRIDQDAEISERFTLWAQAGSDVIRGNLLVIPVDDSVLYVEPVFLEGFEEAIPELRRVIVVYEDEISMQPTFEQAIVDIFGEYEGIDEIPDLPLDPEDPDEPAEDPLMDAELLERVRKHYDKAQEYLEQGDLGKYQEELNKLGKVLEEMEL